MYIAKARTKKKLEYTTAILEWVADHRMESGILSEQIYPYTGKPLSVASLT